MTSIRIASARGDLGIAAYERELAEHSESQRDGQRPTAIAEGGQRQAGHRDTVEIPAVTMAELVESRP